MLSTVPRQPIHNAISALLAMETAPAADVLDTLAGVLGQELACRDLDLWVVDYRLSTLRAVPRVDAPSAPAPVPVEGSTLGQVFTSQEPSSEPTPEGWSFIRVPVTVRSDRLGVLTLSLEHPPTAAERRAILHVATALGHAVRVANRDTDLFEQAARAQRLSLAAEIQWQLLPGRGCAGPDFCLAGQLEPAYHVSGDSFDWSVSREHLYLSVLDGMGRGTPAALLTCLAVSALRNARRAELPLAEQASLADQAIHAQYRGTRYVGALLLRFDRATGHLRAVDAGSPIVLRHRGDDVEPIALDKQLPLGVFEGTHYLEQEVTILPGDRLVVVSDGVHGAKPSGRPELGVDRLCDAIRDLRLAAPPEAARQLIALLLAHHQGAELADDAAVVVCDWGPQPNQARNWS